MTERRNPLSGPVPGDAERQLFAQARAALEANNPAAALPVLEKLFATFPGDVEIAVMFAGVLLAQGHLRRATQCLLDTLSAMPPLPELNARVAKYLHRLGESRGARDCLQQKVLEVPRAAPGLAAMGMMWQTLGVPERALEKFDRAQSFGFDAPAQQYYRGLQLQFMGRSDEACEAWRRCLDKSPGFGRACLSWTRSAGKSHQEALLERADAGLAQAEPDSVDKAAFEFARFHLFESANRPDAAWIALREGNAIMAQRLKHDPACIDHLIGATIAWCDAAFLRAEQSALSAGPQPIFILGMPRSGTTLLERVLGNHTQVVSAGELNDFWQQMRWLTDLPGRQMLDDALLQRLHAINYTELAERYLAQARWRAGDKPFFIDKLPTNVHIAGLIHKAFPAAPILHLVREPMDVCYSNYKAMFGEAYSYSYDIGHLAAYYHQYRRLMQHWHASMPGAILDVSYADLVQDTEATVRKVLDFCGLPYEPACLDVQRNTAPVMTLSTAQVREGIHTRALGEWQRYASQLEPLRAALAAPPTLL